MDYIVLGSNFALLVKSPGDDGQQLLRTGSRLYISLVLSETFFMFGTNCQVLYCLCNREYYDTQNINKSIFTVIHIMKFGWVAMTHSGHHAIGNHTELETNFPRTDVYTCKKMKCIHKILFWKVSSSVLQWQWRDYRTSRAHCSDYLWLQDRFWWLWQGFSITMI